MGWPIIWRPESTGRDMMVSAATILESTTTLHVGAGIAQIYARHPVTTVAAQKTLNEASGGRFLLGLGVAHRGSVEGVRKLDYSRPYSDMVDYLAAMAEAPFRAPESPDSHPVVLAALGPRMLRLAAQAADGAHPYFTPVEHTSKAREIMGPAPLLAPEIMVVIDPDIARGRDTARKTMHRYLQLPNYANNLRRFGFTDADIHDISDRLVDAVVACGTIDKTIERVQEHHDAGADHVCIQVLTERNDLDLTRDHWRELAAAFGL